MADSGTPALVLPLDTITDRVQRIVEVFEAREGELWRVLEGIVERPHQTLVARQVRDTSGAARGVRADLLMRSIIEPEGVAVTHRTPHFVARGARWRFLRVYEVRNELTTDTVPNRFTAHFVRTLASELRRTLRRLERLQREHGEGVDPGLVDDTRALKRRLLGLLARCSALRTATRMEQLPIDNLVLRHDPRYGRVLRAWRALRG